jgi:signal transduction histidine kinase
MTLALLAVAIFATGMMESTLRQTNLLLLWPVVIVAALFAGFVPAILAAVLGIVAIDYWLLAPGRLELSGPTGLLPLGLFIVLAAIISSLADGQRREQQRAVTAEEEATARAVQLADQAMELESQLQETQQVTEELEASTGQLQQLTIDAEEAREAAERAHREIASAFDAVPDSIATFDSDLRLRYLNPVGQENLRQAGFDVQTLYGKALGEGIGETGRELATAAMQAISGKRMVEIEQRVVQIDRWFSHRLVPLSSGLLLISRDVTRERRRVADQRLLSETGVLLATARLDLHQTLRNLTHAVVPHFGDWCSIQLVQEDGNLRQLAVAHVDPEKARWAAEINERYPADPDAQTGAAHVARTGESELYPDIPEELLSRAARDQEHLELLRSVGMKSALAVPIKGGDRVLGALTVVAAESGRRFREADLALAEELGRRAGMAIENARLLAAEQEARASAEASADRIARLQRVTAALSRAATLAEVGRVVVTEGVAALGAQDGGAWLLNRRKDTLELLRSVGLSSAEQTRFRRVPMDSDIPIALAVRERQPVVLGRRTEAANRFPSLSYAATTPGSEAWICVGVRTRDEPLGALALGFAEPREFDDDTLAFVEALSAQCGSAFERARLMAAEQRARGDAEKANRVKTDFLAVMSHELRTPLNAIAGHTELLEIGVHGPVTDAQLEALGRIRRSQRHLLGLINDVLNFAKLEAGHVEYDIGVVPIRSEIEALEPFISPQIAAKEISYSCTADAGLAALADAEKLRQIMLNLLSNSVKFTPEGGSIAVTAKGIGEEVVVEVRDTGIGIPEDKLDQVFAPFVQVGRGLTSVHEGTGLGLAISRDLAEGMNGSLGVESTEGEGSCFILVLPRAKDAAVTGSSVSG